MQSCSQFDAPQLDFVDRDFVRFAISEPHTASVYTVEADFNPLDEEYAGVTVIRRSSERVELHIFGDRELSRRIADWLAGPLGADFRHVVCCAVERSFREAAAE